MGLQLKRDLEITQVQEVEECKAWNEGIQGICSECRRLKDVPRLDFSSV